MFRTLLIAAALAAAGPVHAATSNRPGSEATPKALNASFVTLTALENEDVGCPRTIINARVQVTANINDGGGFEVFGVNAWDDGNFRAGVGFNVPVGATAVYDIVLIYPFEIFEVAAGVGVYIQDGVGLAAVQTWTSNGALAGSATASCPSAPVATASLVSQVGGTPSPVPALPAAMVAVLAMLLGVAGMLARRRSR